MRTGTTLTLSYDEIQRSYRVLSMNVGSINISKDELYEITGFPFAICVHLKSKQIRNQIGRSGTSNFPTVVVQMSAFPDSI